jgi:hypothetical protein
MYNCIPIVYGKIQIQTLTHGYQDCLFPDVFQNASLSLSKIWNILVRHNGMHKQSVPLYSVYIL